MADFIKYHSAVETKGLISYFLRRVNEVRKYIETDEELYSRLEKIESNCKDLISVAEKIIETEKPEERVVEDVDRGINEFLESCECSCDDDCSGGCGGGCGGCGNP